VALRFPEDASDTSNLLAELIAADKAPAANLVSAKSFGEENVGDSQLVLLNSAVLFVPDAGTAVAVFGPSASAHAAAALAPAPVHRRTERPGSVLNDAQIASIKRRLQLTPDQEAMWPAVEAALRTIAYARASDARRRGNKASSPPIDPNSPEVQELKSAAIPLVMSFSGEQKDELRSLAHVLGFDRIASQF
jgi:hypothetical protein